MVSISCLRGGLVRRVLMFALALVFMGLPLYALPGQKQAATPNPAPAPAASPAPALQHLSVDEILAKHYEAIGGDHHQAIQTMTISGTSMVMGMETGFTRYAKRPNMVLLEIYVQGMTGQQAFDGDNAWWFMPFMGQQAAEMMPPDMATMMVEGSEFDGPLIDPAGKGHTVELLGVEPVGDRDAYKLQVTMATGGVQTHYVDTETFYITRVESAEGDTTFHEYKLVDGHPVPHLMEIMGQMGEQTIYVDTVEFNVPLEDALFKMR